jgi:hypothetical protein
MEPKDSLHCSQDPDTGPYLEPAESNLNFLTYSYLVSYHITIRFHHPEDSELNFHSSFYVLPLV